MEGRKIQIYMDSHHHIWTPAHLSRSQVKLPHQPRNLEGMDRRKVPCQMIIEMKSKHENYTS